MRLVLDTDTLISALLWQDLPYQLLQAWERLMPQAN